MRPASAVGWGSCRWMVFSEILGKHATEALPRIRKREGKVSFCFRVLLTEVSVPPGSIAFQSQRKTRRLMLIISSVSAVLREEADEGGG